MRDQHVAGGDTTLVIPAAEQRPASVDVFQLAARELFGLIHQVQLAALPVQGGHSAARSSGPTLEATLSKRQCGCGNRYRSA